MSLLYHSVPPDVKPFLARFFRFDTARFAPRPCYARDAVSTLQNRAENLPAGGRDSPYTSGDYNSLAMNAAFLGYSIPSTLMSFL